jgi:putative flippase GtrA
MVKKTLAYFWSLRHQFIKYFIVGISAVIIDMSSLIFFKEILGMAPVIAVLVNQAVVLVFVFLLNKHWSFKGTEYSHRQLIRYGIVVGFDYLFAVAAMYVFNHLLKFDYRLVRLASIALAVSWNFFLYKYWVYAEIKPAATITNSSGNPTANIL